MADTEPIEFHAIAVEAALLLSLKLEVNGSVPQFSDDDLDHLRMSLEALLGTTELAIAVESLVRLAAILHQHPGGSQAAEALLEVASLAAPALSNARAARADAGRADQERFRSFSGEKRELVDRKQQPRGSIVLRDLAPRKAIR